MGNLNNTFFDALDAAATWSAGVAFKRSKGLPLDKYSVFESKDLAIEYAEKRGAYAETPVSYPGQVIAVQEGTKMVAYVLNENADSTKLELQQIGIIPTGDGKTIDVTEDGKISLLIAEGSDTAAGSQLTLQADGTIKWVKPDTTTAEGQTKAIKALQDTVDGTVTEDGTVVVEGLVHKVGNAASGEDAATGLYKLIADEAKRADDAEKALDAKIGAASVPETAEGTGDGKAASGVYVAIEAEAARAKAAEEALDDRIEILEGKEDKDTTYLVKEGEKVLSLTGTEFGTTLKLAYNDTKIQILGINDELVTELDASAFVADGVLEDVEYDAENDKLIFTWNVIDPETNAKKVVEVDVKDLVDTYTAGNGIDITNNVVSAKVDANDKYLTVDTNGIHTKGIDDAINTAKQEAIGEVTKLANGAVKTNTEAIATLNGDTNTVGSIDAKVAAAEGRVDAKLANKADADKFVSNETFEGFKTTNSQAIADARTGAVEDVAKVGYALAENVVSNDTFNSFKEENTGVINGVAERVEDIEDKLDTVEENAEVNTIKTVKVEGSALTPDSERAVNITRDGLNVYSKDEVNSKVQEATSAANTNTANIDELEKVLYGRVITKDEQYPEQSTVSDGMIAKVANNTARIAAAEGTIAANTAEIAKNTTAASAAQTRADEAYALVGTKANQTYVETELGKKADKSELTEAVNGINASIGETNAEVAKKAVKTEVDAALDLKADKSTTYTKTEIDGKVKEINAEVAKKAVKTEVEAALDLKADKLTTYTKTDVDGFVALLATKEELSDVNETAERGVADAAAAKGVADEALGKIDAFMDTTAASDDVVNTLKEIIELINSEDAELSEALLGEINGLKAKFDENGKALNADKLDGLDSTAFATAEQGTKADNAAATIATYGDIVTHKVEEFATAAQGTKADNAAATIATYGDIVTHNVNEFATAAQGGKADTAIQTVETGTGLKATVDATDATKITIDIDEAVTFILRGGSATGFTTVTENN